MSIPRMRLVSKSMSPVKDWASQMPGKSSRPKWNGDTLKKYREARGWEADDLAAILGVHKSQVYKWEGEGMPKADWFAAILIVFGAPALHFFTGIDEYQGRLKGPALAAKQNIPMLVDGQNVGAAFFSTGEPGAAAPNGATPISDPKARGDAAKPTSESRRARPKRTPPV
jgi:transcriptional regulator with XRE-family HTH domain